MGSDAGRRTAVRVWIVVAIAIGAWIVASSSAAIDVWQDPETTSSPTVATPGDAPTDDDPEPRSDGDFELPDLSWLVDVASVLALLLLLAAIALLISDRDSWLWKLRWRFRDRTRKDRDPPTPAEFEAAPVEVDFDAAEEALAVGTPRNGIVRCWMRLERDAAAVGLERFRSETSAEYAERVVASSSVDAGPIGELAALYREARFSRHELTDDHRLRARRALDGVAAELSRSRARA